MASRISPRGTLRLVASNALTSALSRPVSPEIAARSGRITGSGRKVCGSRPSLGNRPARRKLDLPAPDAPSTTISRGGAASVRPRSRSMASMTGASRPKKMPASSAFQRAQAAVGRPLRIVRRRPLEVAGVQSSPLQTAPEAREAFERVSRRVPARR